MVAFAVLTVASAGAHGQRGPPLVTDDPDTPGNGHWEIILATIGVHTPGRWEVDAPNVDINYGWGENIQLKFEAPWVFTQESPQPWKSGAGTAATPTLSDARGSSSHSGSHSSSASSSHSSAGSHSKAAPWVHRDSHGKIARDPRELNAFKKQHPCPSTGKTYGSCPGYTVDHVIPLKRGGADSPSNMQWQTNQEAKRKDKWE